jgi:hypothetical protein
VGKWETQGASPSFKHSQQIRRVFPS